MSSKLIITAIALLSSLADIPSPALASALTSDQTESSTTTRRRRRRLERQRTGQLSSSSPHLISSRTKPLLINSRSIRQQHYNSLRERWLDILALDEYNRGVRSENRWERRYHYEAELLADTLLGLDDDDKSDDCDGDDYESLRNYCDARCKRSSSLISKEISIVWKSIVIASSGILIGFPLAAFLWRILTSSMIPPSLVPIVRTTVVNYILQAQAILHSMPYLLRHLNQVRIIQRPPSLLPLLLKVIRKCIIIEAWRHIWIQVYKITRFVRRRMTLHNAKLACLRICPAWIRRGIKSIFQSSVQAHVHGAVGGLLTLSTFENFAWSSNMDDGVGGNDDTFIDSLSSMVDLESTIDSTSIQQTILEEATKSIADETMVAIGGEGVDLFGMEGAVDSIVEDCIAGGHC
ncbi:hypothetical protein ACHAWU_000564 [Discostella pseudostelligera]|uniref:Uncharacterized protein n=1 Tax=Discostella pseudostelligera TaxID=259834 RepID=A0ABD3MAZ6_9STRA